MPRDPLNFFSPFEQLPPNHENQLTRALLVVLQMSPMAHASWLRLVAPDHELRRLPVPAFDTQHRSLHQTGDEAASIELVSVFLAPEHALSDESLVTESDRNQVLDATIDYGGELLVVIENKIAPADDWQARQINTTGAKVRIADGQEAVGVLWRDFLEALIALRERRLVGGTEDIVLDQFLTYVEDHFPSLGPFRTLALCRGNDERRSRRLRQVLSEATGREATASYYGPFVAMGSGDIMGANAYLRVRDENGIELSLYPADTLSQARSFYSRPAAIEGLRRLRDLPDWEAGPNFHFGHFQRGYCWTCNDVDLDRYVEIWTQRIASEGQVPRSSWDEYWAWLESEGIACPENRAEFDRHFTATQRQSASPRPGLWISRRWSHRDAEVLDARKELASEVREALRVGLAAFGEAPLAST